MFARMLIQTPPWVLIDGTFGAARRRCPRARNRYLHQRTEAYRLSSISAALARRTICSRKVLHLVTAPKASIAGDKKAEVDRNAMSRRNPEIRQCRRRRGTNLANHVAVTAKVSLLDFVRRWHFTAWARARIWLSRSPATTRDPNAARHHARLGCPAHPRLSRSRPRALSCEPVRAANGRRRLRRGDTIAAIAARAVGHMDTSHPIGQRVVFDIYARAKAMEAQNKFTFAQAFTSAYRESMHRLDDHDAFAATRWLGESPAAYQEALQRSFDQQRARDSIEQEEAVELDLEIRCVRRIPGIWAHGCLRSTRGRQSALHG